MPRFIVKERRAYNVTYLVEAEDREHAKQLPEIIQEEIDTGIGMDDEIISVEETEQESL